MLLKTTSAPCRLRRLAGAAGHDARLFPFREEGTHRGPARAWTPKALWFPGRVGGILLACGMVFCQAKLGAEQFLSVTEALRVCFPDATDFEETRFSLDNDQAKTVSGKHGVKLRPGRYRCWVARRGEGGIGVVVWDRVLGKHEWIDYVVAIDLQGAVKQVEVAEYREHYGGQVRDSQWLRQFRGKTLSDPFKLNDDIHNISGATISCRHVMQGVQRVLAGYEEVLRPQLVAAGKLPRPEPVSAGGH